MTRAAQACRADAALCAKQFPRAYTAHHAAHSWAAEDAYFVKGGIWNPSHIHVNKNMQIMREIICILMR